MIGKLYTKLKNLRSLMNLPKESCHLFSKIRKKFYFIIGKIISDKAS